MENSPSVSIICSTYNHKNFITKCLDSFIMQKTNFKFEALVCDDCSTDGTREIVIEYGEKFPDIIKPVLPFENQFQAGRTTEKTAGMYKACKGKYIAYCEGDDFWTDPYKLQKQFDFLEKNPKLAGCFHPVRVEFENNEKKPYKYPSNKKMFLKNEINLSDLLKSNYIQTNSVMYKKLDSFPNDCPLNIMPLDWYSHLYHCKHGNFGYINEIMGVYRKHSQGIWRETADYKREIAFGKHIVNLYYNIYKNIADSSPLFLNKRVLPVFKNIILGYLKSGYFEDVEKIYNLYPDIFKMALDKMR